MNRGRERLYPGLEEFIAAAAGWFTEASAVRLQLPDARNRALQESAVETRRHMQQLLNASALQSAPQQWLRQIPRYLKAEQRRWQRNTARGSEPEHIGQEMERWSTRFKQLEQQFDAELRWSPMLDEFRFWIEEYRVSLYAQELKTLGAISAARLEQRAVEIEAWLMR